MELTRKIDTQLLPYVQKPARYLGTEYHAVVKRSESIELRVLLAYPDLYEAGIRHVGMEVLYGMANAHPHIWAERVYAPWRDAEAVMRQQAIPLFSLESRTPVAAFDLLFVYLPDELIHTNVLTLLDLGELPLRSEQRGEGQPLVLGGGPGALHPEPLAPFLDAFLPGDPENGFVHICELLVNRSGEKISRKELLRRLAEIPGVYVPALYQPIYSQYGEFQGLEPVEAGIPARVPVNRAGGEEIRRYTLKPPVPLGEMSESRPAGEQFPGILEETGGAPASEGEQVSGLRHRLEAGYTPAATVQLLRATREMLRRAGLGALSRWLPRDDHLAGAVWMAAKDWFHRAGSPMDLSFPDLRFPGLADMGLRIIPALLETAPFPLPALSGSARLRHLGNVNLLDPEILTAAGLLFRAGWKRVQLHLVVGLPTEKPEELNALVQLVQRFGELGQSHSEARPEVVVHPFFPRPFCAFQWEAPELPERLNPRFTRMMEALEGFPGRILGGDPDRAYLAAGVYRGDRRLAAVIESAWRAGARFDNLRESFRQELWQQAIAENADVWRPYSAPISITVPLPWDHLEGVASRSALKQEKLAGFQGELHAAARGMVTLGEGIPRSEWEAVVEAARVEIDRWRQKISGGSEATQSGLPGAVWKGGAARHVMAFPDKETVQYGRRKRKRETPTAVIKRKVRLRYAKTGPARFLSHLDMVRVFHRSAELAGIPLVYSQGKHPTPRISYGPPLAAGIASVAEYLDMEVEIGAEVNIQHLLNEFLPEGVQILQYKGIYSKVPSLGAILNRAEYEVHLGDQVSMDAGWIEAWQARKEVPIQRAVKGEIREVDIRPFVREFRWEENRLIVTVDVIDGRTAKITEVLETLFSPHGVDYRQFLIQRTGQFVVTEDAILSPLDVLPDAFGG
ncbi:MAG: DUF2344 domain-containing protein [Calditrichaeota bacterium]|nr:MAG: DUF2344 domain-containing protein [Calditrichota bacterium]